MHNTDQKATVIWPGPEMRQTLCACPRVFWWLCLHFWCLLRFRAGAQKLAQKWCALPGSLEYSFTPSRALFFATKTLSKNDQKIRDLELDQSTVAKWSNSAYEVERNQEEEKEIHELTIEKQNELMWQKKAGNNNVHWNCTVILPGILITVLWQKLILWWSKFWLGQTGPDSANKIPSDRRCRPKSQWSDFSMKTTWFC